jgi:peptidoglycan/LPS O-acetylase OafA/YrhL
MFMLIVVPRACQYVGISLANPAVYAVILTGVSLAIAAASWHFFEKPINDLKRHFPYRREQDTSRRGSLAVGASSGAGVGG